MLRHLVDVCCVWQCARVSSRWQYAHVDVLQGCYGPVGVFQL